MLFGDPVPPTILDDVNTLHDQQRWTSEERTRSSADRLVRSVLASWRTPAQRTALPAAASGVVIYIFASATQHALAGKH